MVEKEQENNPQGDSSDLHKKFSTRFIKTRPGKAGKIRGKLKFNDIRFCIITGNLLMTVLKSAKYLAKMWNFVEMPGDAASLKSDTASRSKLRPSTDF